MAADTPINPETDEQEDEQVIRPFAVTLQELSKGRTHAELSELLHELIGAVKDTGKAGTLTLTIKVSQMKKTSGDMLVVADMVRAKIPEHDRKESIFFTDDQGNLSRSDPNQPQLPMQTHVRAATVPRATTAKEKRA